MGYLRPGERRMNGIAFRDIELRDLAQYRHWKHPDREHHKFNGPYFRKDSEAELDARMHELASRLRNGEREALTDRRLVVDDVTDELIGEVNWYWKSEETLWMEVGVVIFNEAYWGRGIGAVVLGRWMDEIFRGFPQLVRLGLTTWSGNTRMMRLAEKIGLRKEAVYRKARIVDHEYYDSVSYGILREEWEDLKSQCK